MTWPTIHKAALPLWPGQRGIWEQPLAAITEQGSLGLAPGLVARLTPHLLHGLSVRHAATAATAAAAAATAAAAAATCSMSEIGSWWEGPRALTRPLVVIVLLPLLVII